MRSIAAAFAMGVGIGVVALASRHSWPASQVPIVGTPNASTTGTSSDEAAIARARELLNSHQYDAAKAEIEGLAERRNPEAQNMMGVAVFGARKSEKDDAEAFQWWKLAADQSNAKGSRNLGLAYLNGIGVAKNEPVARRWVLRAAEMGDPRSQAIVGQAYLIGDWFPRDIDAGVAWLKKSASQGNQDAEVMLVRLNRYSAFMKRLAINRAYAAQSAMQYSLQGSSAPNIWGSSTDNSQAATSADEILSRHREALWSSSTSSANTSPQYRGMSGGIYKYDLNRPGDQLRYQLDPMAQLRDSIDPRVGLDRSVDQYGGGIDP